MKVTTRPWRYLMTPLAFAGMLSVSARDEDAVLLIMGEGPATSTAAEEK